MRTKPAQRPPSASLWESQPLLEWLCHELSPTSMQRALSNRRSLLGHSPTGKIPSLRKLFGGLAAFDIIALLGFLARLDGSGIDHKSRLFRLAHLPTE